MFYALLAQQDSTWTFQASQMNTTIFGIHIQPDHIKTIGPIFLLLLIPLWEKFILPILHHLNVEVKPLCCTIIGAFFAVVSFICAGVLQTQIDNVDKSTHNSQINAFYQIPQFLFLMLGEMLLSIPALQYVYINAPIRMKSMMTAFWFCNNAFGNLIVIILTELNFIQEYVWQFYMYAVLMLIATFIFIFLAINYNRQSSIKLVDNSFSFNSEQQLITTENEVAT